MDFEHYMSLSFRQGKEEGEQLGAQKKAIETAIKMIRKNYPTADITDLTDLPIEKVLELKEQLTVQA